MCLGIPMQIKSISSYNAVCVADGDCVTVNTALVDGTLELGSWLLVHQTRAIRILTAEDAAAITRALRAVLAASNGESFEQYFTDLIDREPPLPAHLAVSQQQGDVK